MRDTFALLGDKWSLLIVRILGEGTFRFGELHRIVVGISQRMLTLTLRNLERDGLVSRTIYPEVPPRVEYQLTALGRTLVEPVSALSAWALAHHAEIERHHASASSPLSSRSGGGIEEVASPGD
ncbi:MAG: transcriptional regulator [Proteobacteria bacterium]|nr:transcriptional regulator [Pseudomonadota bacterium]